MPYVILDPVGTYPEHLLTFLGGKLVKAGIAVFTDHARAMLWRDKWSRSLGKYVVDTFQSLDHPSVAHLAHAIRSRHGPVEGVVPWDEETVLLGARLSEYLDLDWNTLEVMQRCRDKAVMKAWLRASGRVRINGSAIVTSGEQALAFQRAVGGWPIVVKPTSGSGSEDVYFPRSDEALLRDCQRVLEAASCAVLLEEYIGGDEFIVNGQVDARGDLLVTDVWLYDRRESHGIPNLFYQTFKVPTSAPAFAPIARYAGQVIEVLGLRRCPIHMELKVDGRGPCLIEVGARFSGGNLAVLASKLHGRSLLELAACHYLAELPLTGNDIDRARYDRLDARVVHGLQTAELPRITQVHGADTVRALPSFDAFTRLRPVGTRAPLTRDLDTAAWELSLLHEDAAQVQHDAHVIRQVLRYS